MSIYPQLLLLPHISVYISQLRRSQVSLYPDVYILLTLSASTYLCIYISALSFPYISLSITSEIKYIYFSSWPVSRSLCILNMLCIQNSMYLRIEVSLYLPNPRIQTYLYSIFQTLCIQPQYLDIRVFRTFGIQTFLYLQTLDIQTLLYLPYLQYLDIPVSFTSSVNRHSCIFQTLGIHTLLYLPNLWYPDIPYLPNPRNPDILASFKTSMSRHSCIFDTFGYPYIPVSSKPSLSRHSCIFWTLVIQTFLYLSHPLLQNRSSSPLQLCCHLYIS